MTERLKRYIEKTLPREYQDHIEAYKTKKGVVLVSSPYKHITELPDKWSIYDTLYGLGT